MATTVLQVRVDRHDRDEAAALFTRLGLDLPTAIRMFISKSLDVRGLPFDVREEVPNEETERAMRNVLNGEGLSRAFTTVEELMEDLNADDPI